jgi:hypothetical protein
LENGGEKAEKKSSEAVDSAAGSGHLSTRSIYFMTFKTHIRNQAMQLINLLAGQRIVEEAWITVIKLIIAADTIFGIRQLSKESQENIALLCLVINF